MEDDKDLVLSSETLQDFGEARRSLNSRLPIEVRKKLNGLFIDYMSRFGPEGAFARMNGRTVGDLISDQESVGDPDPRPVKSGEIDGVRYRLYGAPWASGGAGPTEGGGDRPADG